MNIIVNGELAEVAAETTIARLLEQRARPTGVAIAVNGTFVPRSQYGERQLAEGDKVEIVAPMQGG
ncbi:MAG: sulfur carrier protein ThiS [Verrucomicrobia bacterium]|nr:sulfur carrier protein ThiS [Verrucomicrobiota bacterium]